MKKNRIIFYSCIAVATVLLALAPVALAGSSTLSGYGGPGEGNQAVLGSALVGGHGGGRGSGTGSGGQGGGAGAEGTGSGSPAAESGSSGSQGAAGAGEAGSTPAGTASGGGGGGGGSGKSKPSSSSRGSARPRVSAHDRPAIAAKSYYPAAEHVPAGGQGTLLGLTGDDLLYVILALVILALLGLLTRRLDDSASSAHTRG